MGLGNKGLSGGGEGDFSLEGSIHGIPEWVAAGPNPGQMAGSPQESGSGWQWRGGFSVLEHMCHPLA